MRLFIAIALMTASCTRSEPLAAKRDPTRERAQKAVDLRPHVRDGAPMHDPRGNHFAMRLEGARVLVMGGGPRSIEIYDANVDKWTHWDDLPASLSWVAGAPIDAEHAWVLLSSFEPMRYEVTSKTFTKVAPLPYTACAVAFARLPSGKIAAVGGQDCGRPGETVPNVALYDPVADKWSTHAPLHHARSWADVAGTFTAGRETIWVRGGAEPTEMWDPKRETWVDVAEPQLAELNPGAVSTDLGDGRTVTTGGLESCGRACLHPTKTTKIYFFGRS